MLPKLKAVEGANGSNKLPFIVEGVQYAGETVFVPSGWWHASLNLDLTVAVTENLFNDGNFDAVWRSTRQHRRKLSVDFLE